MRINPAIALSMVVSAVVVGCLQVIGFVLAGLPGQIIGLAIGIMASLFIGIYFGLLGARRS